MNLASPRLRVPAAATVVAALALSATSLVAAPANAAPTNDYFAHAAALSSSVSVVGYGSNVGATTETGEPLTTTFNDTVSSTVWWTWTAPVSGNYAISTAGSAGPAVGGDPHPALDTTLSVYTGPSLSALTPVASNNDNALQDLTSATGFSATAGTTYDIQVGVFGTTTGTIRLSIGAADVAGSMTFETSSSTAQPRAGCLGFYTDITFTTVVAGGCGSGASGTTAAFAVGLVPEGTYFVEATDNNGVPIYYPGGTNPAAAVPLTISGGGCTQTGFGVNFASGFFTPASARTCPFAPACQQAKGAAVQASATLSVANAALSAAQAQVTADQKAIAATKLAIKKAKKKHRSTTALTKKLAKLTQRLAVDNATLAAARTAATFATAGQASAAAAVNGSC